MSGELQPRYPPPALKSSPQAITLKGEVVHLPLIKLFFLYFRLSLWTFGGGVVLLRFLERELVEKGLLTREDMQETITLAVSVPGSIMANLAFLTGRRLHGWAGAVVAVTGTAIPPFFIILAVAGIFFGTGEPAPWIKTFLGGVLAVVAALVLDVALERIGQLYHKGPGALLVFLAVLGLALWGIHPLLALGAGGAMGTLLMRGDDGK